MLKILFSLILICTPLNALACDFDEQPKEYYFEKAKAVVRAKLVKVELVSANEMSERLKLSGKEKDEITKFEFVKGTYKPIEVFKGDVGETGEVYEIVTGPGNCSVALMVGLEYVFFINDKGFISIADSEAIINPEAPNARELLGKLRKLKKI